MEVDADPAATDWDPVFTPGNQIITKKNF